MRGIALLKQAKKNVGINSVIPPTYTMFLRIFELGRGCFKVRYFKSNEDLIQLTSITYFGSTGYENSVSYFLSASDLEEELEKYDQRLDDYHKQGFIKIGLFDINDSILLGVSKQHEDEIWKLNGDWGDERPYKEKLSSNIFEFVNSCQETIILVNLIVRKISKNDLYKNWGEDFWRIRGEKEQ
jgi:hypothetical protein